MPCARALGDEARRSRATGSIGRGAGGTERRCGQEQADATKGGMGRHRSPRFGGRRVQQSPVAASRSLLEPNGYG